MPDSDLPPGFAVDNPAPAPAAAPADLPPGFQVNEPPPLGEHGLPEIQQMAKANNANPEGANSMWSGFKHGLDESSTHLIFGKPTTVAPEHADLYYTMAQSAGGVVGDLPAMTVGGIGGAIGGTAAGGSVANVPGAIAGFGMGAWAGAGALPAIIRKVMMDHYEKGTVTGVTDFLGRVGGAAWAGMKGAVTNLVTQGVGKVVGPAAQNLAGNLVGSAAKHAAELAAMTTTAAGFEGRMPEPHEFADNAFVLLATHGVTGAAEHVASRLRGVYADTGLHPAEVTHEAAGNPILTQKLLSTQDSSTPTELSEAAPQEPMSDNDKAWLAANPEPKVVPAPESPAHPNFSEDSPVGQVSVPQLPKSAELIDTRNGGQQFHGTSNEIKGFYEGGYNEQNIYGQGLYTTDALDIAKGYSKKGRGGNPTIYNVAEKQPVKLYDMETPISDDLRSFLEKQDHSNSDLIHNALEDNPKNLRELYDDIREYSKAEGISANDVHESIFYPIQDELTRQGYGGLQHTGGLLTNKNPHTVKIYFNPEKDIAVSKTDISKFQKTIGAESGTAGGGKPPSEPPPPGSLDAAKAYIDSKITSAPEIAPEKLTWDKVQQRVLDQTHGLAVLARELTEGKELPTMQDPYLLARLTAGTNSMFRAAVEFGPVDAETKQPLEGVKSYKEIFAPLGDRVGDFQRWMVAQRVVEKAGQGIKALGEEQNLDAAKQVAADGAKEFGPVAKEYAKWKNSFIDNATKRGLFSAEQAAKIKEMNESHISFNRLFEDEESFGPGGKNLKVNNPVKGMRGSERAIVDPLKNDMMNAYKLMQASERNAVINTLAGLAETNPEAAAKPESLFQKAAPEFQKFTVGGKEVNAAFEEEGVDPEATGDFWRAKHSLLGKDQVQSFVEGKRVVWDTTPATAEAIKGIQDSSQASALQSFINGPGRLLRTAQMMYPVFWERHFIRSQENAMALSKLGTEPILQMHNAIAGMFTNSEDYQQFLASGGGNESWHSVQDYIDKTAGGGLEKTTNFMDSMMNGVKSIPEATILGFHKMEESLHFAKYLAERGKDQSPESIANAAFEARSVNGDIAMRGSSNIVKWYSAATPFWAQHMAGLAETGKAFKNDFAGTFAKMAAVYTIPAVLNWWQNKDDERWHDLPPWQKTMSLPIFTNKWEDAPPGFAPPEKNTAYSRVTPEGRVQINNGSSWKIPMFETGMMFASMPVAALDAMYRKTPEAFKGFGEGLLHTAMPLDLPAVLHPILEHFANKSTLTGNPIIPSGMEGRGNIDSDQKFTDYTSETAKQMGKLIHQIPAVGDTDLAAPIMIENYIRSWTGGPGMLALKLADKALQNLPASARQALNIQEPIVKPDGTWADNPFTMAFAMRNPGMSSQPVHQLFENYDKYIQTKNTVEIMKKRGDMEALDRYLADPENQKNLIPQDTAHKAVMQMSQYLNEITKDPGMSGHDKRQLYDATLTQMVLTARGQNKMREERRADFDQAGAGP